MKKNTSEDTFKNIEYIELIKNRKTVFVFPGNEVENISKFDLQKKIGELFGNETFTASIKFVGQFNNKRFLIKGLSLDNKKIEIPKSENEDLKSNMNNQLDTTIEILKLSYTSIIDSLKTQNSDLRNSLEKKEKELKILNDSENELKDKIRKLENEIQADTGNEGLLTILSQLASLKGGLGTKLGTNPGKLSDQPDSIPAEISNILNKIDFERVPKEMLKQYIAVFNQFASQLPNKGN